MRALVFQSCSTLRSRLAACVLLVAALASPGCLVTNQVDFEQTNVPANILDQQPATFTRVPPDLDLSGCPQAGRMAFQARVIDANIEDTLRARLVINGELAPETQYTIKVTEQADRGAVLLCAKINRLSLPCNRVEMAVSRAFTSSADPYETEDPDDLAKVEWWVLGQAGKVPQAIPQDCTDLFDGGVP